ncbi:hypothetical protein NQZ68_037982 [Dissostichus eleginoides]|nr:hypothetical protein NQZ68_037982 [Dissostichus eleginoides]
MTIKSMALSNAHAISTEVPDAGLFTLGAPFLHCGLQDAPARLNCVIRVMPLIPLIDITASSKNTHSPPNC